MSDGPIYSMLSGKACCTSNLNISGMSRANGCYTFFPSPGNNSYFNDLGEEGYVLAYMNGFEPGELQVYDLINNQQIAYIIFNSNSNCPLTGTYPITGSNAGGNATIVCGC